MISSTNIPSGLIGSTESEVVMSIRNLMKAAFASCDFPYPAITAVYLVLIVMKHCVSRTIVSFVFLVNSMWAHYPAVMISWFASRWDFWPTFWIVWSLNNLIYIIFMRFCDAPFPIGNPWLCKYGPYRILVPCVTVLRRSLGTQIPSRSVLSRFFSLVNRKTNVIYAWWFEL